MEARNVRGQLGENVEVELEQLEQEAKAEAGQKAPPRPDDPGSPTKRIAILCPGESLYGAVIPRGQYVAILAVTDAQRLPGGHTHWVMHEQPRKWRMQDGMMYSSNADWIVYNRGLWARELYYAGKKGPRILISGHPNHLLPKCPVAFRETAQKLMNSFYLALFWAVSEGATHIDIYGQDQSGGQNYDPACGLPIGESQDWAERWATERAWCQELFEVLAREGVTVERITCQKKQSLSKPTPPKKPRKKRKKRVSKKSGTSSQPARPATSSRKKTSSRKASPSPSTKP